MVVKFHCVKNYSDQNLRILTALFDEMFIFPSKDHFLNIFTKSTCKGFENPYNAPHTTTHCCEVFKFPGASLFFAL